MLNCSKAAPDVKAWRPVRCPNTLTCYNFFCCIGAPRLSLFDSNKSCQMALAWCETEFHAWHLLAPHK